MFMLAYGFCISAIAFDNPYHIFIMGACFAIGSAPGWSDSYGAIIDDRPMHQMRLTWWQKGPLAYVVWPAQVARGIIWALPCFLVAYFYGGWEVGLAILIAHPIALPLAVKIKSKYQPWKVSEVLRGLLTGALCVTFGTF